MVPIVSVTKKEHIMTHNVLWYMMGHNKYLGSDRDTFSHVSLLKLEVILIERYCPQLKQWPAALCIQQKSHHGNTFRGKECNILLKNLDTLQSMLPPHVQS